MATYFDKREGRAKPIPDCAKHGLVWDETTQRCERKSERDLLAGCNTGLGLLMAEDFIIDDYGGGFYGGGGDYYGSGVGDDFYYGYGSDQPTPTLPDLPFFQGPDWWSVPLEPPLDPVADQAFLADEFFYDPSTGDVVSDPGASALSFDQLFWEWIGLGLNHDDAVYFAQLDLEAAAPGDLIRLVSAEEGLTPSPVQLPDIGPLPPFPYTPFTPWETPPIIPELEIYFPLPPPPPPAPPKPKLPPACYGPTYHPYPIGHPQQDICVPFPPAPKPPAQQSKPPAQSQSSASKPPAQQPKTAQQQQGCKAGYCKHPQTGQWIPTPRGYYCHPQTQICSPRCTTQGTVYDQAKGQCVPVAQATKPLPGSEAPGTELPDVPEEVSSAWEELKKLPWWLWAAAAGLIAFGMSDKDGGTTRRRTR